MRMQMIAEHKSTIFFHKRNRYQARLLCLISFSGMIPITVGKMAPIHHRRAQLPVILRDGSRLGVRNEIAAAIVKLRKSRI